MGTALGVASTDGRPHVIVFLTDGKPTIGETDSKVILEHVKKSSGSKARIFVFGVGEDLNAHLLDSISLDNGGASQYVAPNEDIEVKVSSFADKINMPVLSQPKVTIDKLDVKMIHPQELADLFAGDQVTIFGRYNGGGDHAIRLTGEINGKREEYVFESAFPTENADNDFLPRLWATRRVGYLLDEIRLHGEEDELRNEVVQLGAEYGIMTPYTSYLVLENDQAYRDHGVSRNGEHAAVDKRGERGSHETRQTFGIGTGTEPQMPADAVSVPMFAMREETASPGAPSALSRDLYGESTGKYLAGATSAGAKLGKEEGRSAIEMSVAIARYKKADAPRDDMGPMVRAVGKKVFYLVNGVWTDRDYRPEMKATKVRYASDEYFKLLAQKPELKKYMALGEKIIVVTENKAAIVVE